MGKEQTTNNTLKILSVFTDKIDSNGYACLFNGLDHPMKGHAFLLEGGDFHNGNKRTSI